MERAPLLFWLAFNLYHVSPSAFAKWSSTEPDRMSMSISSCSFSLFHVAPSDFAKWSSTEPATDTAVESVMLTTHTAGVVVVLEIGGGATAVGGVSDMGGATIMGGATHVGGATIVGWVGATGVCGVDNGEGAM